VKTTTAAKLQLRVKRKALAFLHISRSSAKKRIQPHQPMSRLKGVQSNKNSQLQSTIPQRHYTKTLPRGRHYIKFVCLHLLVATATWRIVLRLLMMLLTQYVVLG